MSRFSLSLVSCLSRLSLIRTLPQDSVEFSSSSPAVAGGTGGGAGARESGAAPLSPVLRSGSGLSDLPSEVEGGRGAVRGQGTDGARSTCSSRGPGRHEEEKGERSGRRGGGGERERDGYSSRHAISHERDALRDVDTTDSEAEETATTAVPSLFSSPCSYHQPVASSIVIDMEGQDIQLNQEDSFSSASPPPPSAVLPFRGDDQHSTSGGGREEEGKKEREGRGEEEKKAPADNNDGADQERRTKKVCFLTGPR